MIGEHTGMKNVSAIFLNGLCSGCGTCVSSCPKGIIGVGKDKKYGIFKPVIDEKACIECGCCIKVCPGRGIVSENYEKAFIHGENKNKILGSYRSLKLGYSNDEMVRRNGASGGMVTAILLYMLEKGLIQGAVVTAFDKDKPLQGRSFIATTKEEILKSQSSIYTQSSTNIVLKDLLKRKGKYAFVGLPCQVQGLRMLQRADSRYREKIAIVLGIYCANSNTDYSIEYFLSKKGICDKDVCKIDYRYGCWPGNIHIETTDNTYDFERKGTTFKNAFQGKFAVPRCVTCDDMFGTLADVSFGDPHFPEIKRIEKVGISWYIIRNRNAENILSLMEKENYICQSDFSDKRVVSAGNILLKSDENIDKRIAYLKKRGKKVPNYGREIRKGNTGSQEMKNYKWAFIPYGIIKKVYLFCNEIFNN